MFRKVLVANRGEIAVRVMRACEELDVDTVAIYSAADTNAGHVRRADEAYNVGPARATESYLDHEAVLEAARKADADAIHPGYGFLAENASFARKVEEADGVTWIGPSSEAMEQLGEKTSARRIMRDADVPIVPGTTEPVTDADAVASFADEHGYPVAIKAEGGGGGRGMKIVRDESEIDDQLASAKREGEAYFGNDSVYLERFLDQPRHVEVQIIADEHGTVCHLGERDCSLQRRHQKVVEEAPSPALDDELRERIGDAATRGVGSVGYVNAGTVEFLVPNARTTDESRQEAGEDFYFLEMNTRIQVEHCVTEEITGIDIVKNQLRVAAGEPLPFSQSDVTFDGHAMEFRINAENAAEDFRPSAGGRLETYDPPGGVGVRVDDALRQGDEIVTDYDSMIAKLIVWGGDRGECIARSARALREYEIEGVTTIIPLHRLIVSDEAFVAGEHTTSYLDEELDVSRLERAQEQWGTVDSTSTPGSVEDGAIEREFTVEVNGKRFEVSLADHDGNLLADDSAGSSGSPTNPPSALPTASSTPSSAGSSPGAERGGTGSEDSSKAGGAGEQVAAEMQGTILSVAVEAGDAVEPGDVLVVLEAMKMENDIVASRAGTVTEVAVAEGESVDMGDPLVSIE